MVKHINTHTKVKTSTINAIVICLMFGVIFTGVSLYGIQEFSNWREQGIAAKATVLDKYMDEDCQTGSSSNSCLDTFILEYQYQLSESATFMGRDSVNETIWDNSPIGSDVDLLYLVHSPQTSSINYAHDLDLKIGLWRGLLGLGVLLIVIGLFITAKVIVKKF